MDVFDSKSSATEKASSTYKTSRARHDFRLSNSTIKQTRNMISKESTSSMAAQPVKNWSILSIPASYGLALLPHYYFFGRAMLASKFAYTNALPRANLETLKSKLPEATWKSLVRARGAHLNGLESFPIFASAIVSFLRMLPNS